MSYLALISYVIIMSITPGPNNLLLASSGVNVGLRRSMPMSIGVSIGSSVQCLIALTAFGWLFRWIEAVRLPLALLGCAYLLWLAFVLYQSSTPRAKEQTFQPMSFLQMALFQWVNPKAWLMALNIAVLFGSVESAWHHYIGLSALVAMVNYPCIFIWLALGDRLKNVLCQPRQLKLFNLGMALLMGFTALWLLFDELYLFFKI